MLSSEELEAILDSALDAVGEEAAWAACLARIRRGFHASSAALIAHDFATGRGRWCLADGLDPALAPAYAEGWAAESSWLAAPDAYRPGRAMLGEALVPAHALVRTAFYTDYLRPQDCWHRLAGTLLRVGPRIVYLTLHRPPGAPEFDTAELHALEWLLPRLARPVALHRELLRRIGGSEAFRAVLEQVPHALFLVDDALRPVAMNAAAAALAGRGAPLRLAAGRLAAARGVEDAALRRLVQAVLADAPGPAPAELALPREADAPPVLLRAARLGRQEGLADAPEALVLLLVLDPEAERPNTAALAGRLWRLTPAEARLCELLARGLRPGEAARTLGSSPHTVHAQLRQVFAKAGVHRQADLLRLLERLSLPSS